MQYRLIAAGALLFLLPNTANADQIVYSDLASWSSAVPAYTSMSIPDPGPPNDIAFFGTGDASVTYVGITFSTSASLSDGGFYNVGPNATDPFSGAALSNGDVPVLSSQQQTTGVTNILIKLAAPVTAVSLNYGTFYGSNVTFDLSNGYEVTLGSTANGYLLTDFFGIADSSPFNTILLTSTDPIDPNSAVLSIGGLNFGPGVTAVPEASTWILVILGFLGLGVLRSGAVWRAYPA